MGQVALAASCLWAFAISGEVEEPPPPMPGGDLPSQAGPFSALGGYPRKWPRYGPEAGEVTFAKAGSSNPEDVDEGLQSARRGLPEHAASVFAAACSSGNSSSTATACNNWALALVHLGAFPESYAVLRIAYERGAQEEFIIKNREVILFWARRLLFPDEEGFDIASAERALARAADAAEVSVTASDELSYARKWRDALGDPLVHFHHHFQQNARLLRLLGLNREAREVFRTAAFFFQAKDSYLSNLGASLLEGQELAEACVVLEAAFALNGPTRADVWRNLNVLRHKVGGDEGMASLRSSAPRLSDILQVQYNFTNSSGQHPRTSQHAHATGPSVWHTSQLQRPGETCAGHCQLEAQTQAVGGASDGGEQPVLSAHSLRRTAHWLFAPEEWYLWDGIGYSSQAPPAAVSPRVVSDCLPEVPIVYAYAPLLPAVAAWSEVKFRRPFILVTAGSDLGASKSRFILEDQNVVHWFAQQVDFKHERISALPLGVNAVRFVPLESALRKLRDHEAFMSERRLLLARFDRRGHPSHARWWRALCDPQEGSPFATCEQPGEDVRSVGAEFDAMAAHRFVAAPPGLGPDTARVWEALHLGVVPIVESSGTSSLYEGLPVLVVEDIAKVTEEELLRKYGELAALFEEAVPEALRKVPGTRLLPAFRPLKLQSSFWHRKILDFREGVLQSSQQYGGISEQRTFTCWKST